MEKVPFGKFGFINRMAFDWLSQNLSAVISGVVVVIAAASWSVYQSSLGSPRDYLLVEKTFNQWNGDRNEQLIQIQKFLKQHPELHAKYDGRIAQKLLLSSQQGLAASFSKLAFKRIGNFSPYYTQFSHCSLLIGERKFQEALAQAKTLKAALDQDSQFWQTKSALVKHGQVLYGYNLLRIAFLEQELGNSSEELKAWKVFKQQAGWTESDAASDPIEHSQLLGNSDTHAYELICQNFQKNDTSLKDFIRYREALLTTLEY